MRERQLKRARTGDPTAPVTDLVYRSGLLRRVGVRPGLPGALRPGTVFPGLQNHVDDAGLARSLIPPKHHC